MNKRFIMIALVFGMSLILISQCLAATNRIILDPLSSYEVQQKSVVTIPVGATMSQDGACAIFIEGLPTTATFVLTTGTSRRTAGYIDGVGQLPVGKYNVRITAFDSNSGVQTVGTLKIIVGVSQTPNAPIIFSPLESHKNLSTYQYETIAVSVNDDDAESLVLFASGLPYGAKYTQTSSRAGHVGGYLELSFSNAGNYTFSLIASDKRTTGRNTAVAQMHIEVQ